MNIHLKFIKEEVIREVTIGNVVIMLLLYANDVVFFANTSKDAQKYLCTLKG